MRRNRTGDFGAQALCLGFGFGSCHSFQRAGKDDGFAGKRRIVVYVVDEVFNRYFFKQAIDGADVVFFIENSITSLAMASPMPSIESRRSVS